MSSRRWLLVWVSLLLFAVASGAPAIEIPGVLAVAAQAPAPPGAAARVPPPKVRTGMSDAELGDSLDAYLAELAKTDLFSGAVLLARDGRPFFKRAYGLASRRFDVPNRVDTKFNLGSINKVFTMIAVAQLAGRGKLSFDDTVAGHLPDYPKDTANKITVRHLLEHTSGLGDIFTEEFHRSANTLFVRPRDFFPLFMNRPVEFEPGQGKRYSNAGYMVLGAIVEAASGQDYFDYVRDHIYRPAGMTDTDCYEADLPVANLAEGYTRQSAGAGGSWRSNVFLKLYKGSPAGGGYSTVDDLLKLAEALRSYTLLSPELTRAILGGGEPTPQRPGPGSSEAGGFPATAFAGGAPGTNALLELEGEYTTIVLANCDPPAAVDIGRTVRSMLDQREGRKTP